MLKSSQTPIVMSSGKILYSYFDARIVHRVEELSPEMQEWILEEEEENLFYV